MKRNRNIARRRKTASEKMDTGTWIVILIFVIVLITARIVIGG